MEFDWRKSVPEEAFDKTGKFSVDLHSSYFRKCTNLAEQIASAADVSVVEHRALVLVDLQGVYLALVDWLQERGFILESGRIISRIAIFLFMSVVDAIKSDVMLEAGMGAISFEGLMGFLLKKQYEKVESTKYVVKVQAKIELFYAPAPLDEIEKYLQKNVRNGIEGVTKQLTDVRRGVLEIHKRERDYRYYDDFVRNLKTDPLVADWKEGFFSFFVGLNGLQMFDEKEVDVRIAIRAVDACVECEVDSLCIVSSDQDFLPLHERCKRSNVRTYQADVARFASQEKVARKFKKLGAGLIPTGVDPSWPLKIILEATAPFDIYTISMEELKGLCRLHNALNEIQLSASQTEGGGVTLTMHRPL